jgi:hypothetical protein
LITYVQIEKISDAFIDGLKHNAIDSTHEEGRKVSIAHEANREKERINREKDELDRIL